MLTPADLPDVPPPLQPVVDAIMRREGTRFTDDPDDPGGPTQCGISLRFARAARLDLDGDGDTDLADIQAVTVAIAQRIMVHTFYAVPGGPLLPAPLQAFALDTAFNMGVGGAAAVLAAVVVMGGRSRVGHPLPFGQVAPALAALVAQQGDAAIVDSAVRCRLRRYEDIIERNPRLARFRNGWTLRALAFGSPALRAGYRGLLTRYGEQP